MSTYQPFPSLAAALDAFAAGQCRRHVEVGGHVIDLVQAMAEQGRVREDQQADPQPWRDDAWARGRDAWDRVVAANVRAALSIDVLPPLAAPEIPRPRPGAICPCCLRPEEPT